MAEEDIIDHIKVYSDYLDNLNHLAYCDVNLLSNITLSKNPYTGSQFLQNIIQNNEVKISRLILLKSSVLFILKNIYYFIFWLFYYLYTKIFISKKLNFNEQNIILIETFFNHTQINKNHMLIDNYFQELHEFLNKSQLNYIVIPKIFGVDKNPIKMLRILKYLSRLENSNITEFDIFSIKDLFRILKFIINYPFIINKFTSSMNLESKIDKLFVHDFIATLQKTVFISHAKYLFGEKLKFLFYKKNVKLISWCEYQTNDKNFYKGIKSGNTHIYGCQFFIKYPTLVSSYIPDIDKKHGIAPDTILVNGSYYIPNEPNYKYKVGPAFRYRHVVNFNRDEISNTSSSIFVMLPYVQEDAFEIIRIMRKSKFFMNSTIDFKIHPDFVSDRRKYDKRMVEQWRLTNRINNINSYGILISSGSGTLIEYAAMGISVLIIASKLGFTTNPMPRYGKKIIWDIAYNEKDLELNHNKLINQRKNNFGEVMNISKNYLNSYFSEIHSEKIIENFDLKHWIHSEKNISN